MRSVPDGLAQKARAAPSARSAVRSQCRTSLRVRARRRQRRRDHLGLQRRQPAHRPRRPRRLGQRRSMGGARLPRGEHRPRVLRRAPSIPVLDGRHRHLRAHLRRHGHDGLVGVRRAGEGRMGQHQLEREQARRHQLNYGDEPRAAAIVALRVLLVVHELEIRRIEKKVARIQDTILEC